MQKKRFLLVLLAFLVIAGVVCFGAYRLLARQLDVGEEQAYTLNSDEVALDSCETPAWGTMQLVAEPGGALFESSTPGLPLTVFVGKDVLFTQDKARLEWTASSGALMVWIPSQPLQTIVPTTNIPPNFTLYWQPDSQLPSETPAVLRIRVLDSDGLEIAVLEAVLYVDASGVYCVGAN